MALSKKIIFVFIIFTIFIILTACAKKIEVQKTDTASKTPATLEDALSTKVNNPIDNAIKLHQVKDKLEERLKTSNDKFIKEMVNTMKDAE